MADIALLNPGTRGKCETFLSRAAAAGLDIIVTQTWRTKEYQDGLYAQGRTKPGNVVTNCKYPQSPHCWGVAFDIAIRTKKHDIDWSAAADTDGDGINDWTELRDIGIACGLYWGGDWKGFVDRPHFEDIDFMPGNSVKTLVAKYGSPDQFKATWYEYIVKGDDDMKKINGIIAGKPVDAYLDDRGKSYVPAGALRDLGLTVGWDGKTETVSVGK